MSLGIGVGVISDLHAHLWPQCATFTKHGTHRRLLDAGVVLLKWAEYIKAAGVDVGVINGDLVHPRGYLYHQVYATLALAFQRITKMGIKLYAIPGNHDYDERCRSHVWEVFKPWVQVFERPTLLPMGGLTLGFLPYFADPTDVIKEAKGLRKAHVLMGHLALQNMPSRSGYIWGREVPRAALPKDMYILSGHYHQHALVDHHFVYPGAPLQHTWGDEGEAKGLWWYTLYDDLEPQPHVQVGVRAIPTFWTIQADDARLADPKFGAGQFVRVAIPQDMPRGDAKALVERLQQLCRWVGTIPLPPGTSLAAVKSHPGQVQTVKSSLVTYVKQRVKQANRKAYAQQGWSYVKKAMEQP